MTRILAERLTSSENARRKVSLCRVFVRDLVVSCSIGVHADEHDAPQRVRINVDLWAEESPSPVDDDIANVVSYEDIVTGIETLLGKTLDRHGFRRVYYDPYQRALSSEPTDYPSSNALFVKDEEAVAARLREAPPVRVLDQSI